MALITPSALLSNISGKLGGGVFSKTCGGSTLRIPPPRSRSLSSYQQVIQNRVTMLSRLWQTLDESARGEWNYFSSFYVCYSARSGSYKLGGYQLFIKLNLNKLLIGGTVSNTPTWDSFQYTLSEISVTLYENEFNVSFLPAINPALILPVLFCTDNTSPGISNADGRYYYIPQDSYSSIDADYINNFETAFRHPPTIGRVLFLDFCLYQISSGIPCNSVLSKVPIIDSP
jgi:hypothetical protein